MHLPRNMGPAHRALYVVIGAAAILFALVAAPLGWLARLGIATLGLMTLASGFSGH